MTTFSQGWTIGNGVLNLVNGDITHAETQAIVNAANSQLEGGGGVDGAIQKAAGPELLQAGLDYVTKHGPVTPGNAVLTPGFELKADYVIHAVGPLWKDGEHDEEKLLASVYHRCLDLARQNSIKSIAFPAISCGAYGFPVDKAAPLALRIIQHGLATSMVDRVDMYLHSEKDFQTWIEQAKNLVDHH